MMEGKIQDKTENPRGFGGVADPEPEVNKEGAEIATEEEQLDYDLLTVRAQKIMFGSGKDKILTMLGTGESPAQSIGKVGAMIIKSLMQSSKQAGREIDGNTAIHAAIEVAEDLNALAKKNDVFQYESPEEEKKELDDAMLWGVKYYGDGMIANGEITPEMQQLAQKQVDEGLAEEAAAAPKPKQDKVASAVKQATAKPGIVNSAMGGY